ncbi:MAG: nucleotide exchange factor GrpE, partial [Planctomycetota bacterium]
SNGFHQHSLDGPPEVRSVGLFQLIEEFTALRHELKLQTKSARGLEERSVATLDAMQAAIEQFRLVKADESQAAEGAARPLVEALLDLHEALERGRKVIETARRRILDESAGQLQDQLDDLFRRQSWWRRWIGRSFHEATRQLCSRQAEEVHRVVFESLVEGYGLIQNRATRAMDKEGLCRIDCLGKPVDPNAMMVVEVIEDPTRPPGLVVEEVRPGYYWKAKVFRFAEVRAVQGRISEGD